MRLLAVGPVITVSKYIECRVSAMISCLRARVCNGFSWIELLVTLSILAMLLSVGMPSPVTSIAYCSYQNYMIKARLTDAQAVLIQAALFMERFYKENNYYDQDTGGTAVARPAPINESPLRCWRKGLRHCGSGFQCVDLYIASNV